MFKPLVWEFRESVYWPGRNTTHVLQASECEHVAEDGDSLTFVHPSGQAVRVYKAQVREVRGTWNVPTPEVVKPKAFRGKTGS